MDEAAQAAAVEALIARYGETGGQERANYVSFLTDLCDAIGVPRPDPANATSTGAYQFERTVKNHHDDGAATTLRIDLYRRACFILEAKQGSNAPPPAGLFGMAPPERRAVVRRTPGWVQAMMRAKGQAEGYVRKLPADEPSPPFLIACDIGSCFDIYADFSGTGRHYAQYPDRERFRIYVTDLRRPEVRALLRAIWTDPTSLDPARERVKVTRDIARYLAKLARALEGPRDRPRHHPEDVATFLIRCIFTMFAQSVGLLPTPDAFTGFLQSCRDTPDLAGRRLSALWRDMDKGSAFSEILRGMVLRFNGGLFRAGGDSATEVMTLDADALALLIVAAEKDWSVVEPAIFGTLLEDALDERERGELGAHFTPRDFVERLVVPAVMDPLREEWDAVKAAATARADGGDRPGAAALVRAFHAGLCGVKVLDPACGTGNFLYVTMELMKRLEGEVLDLLADLSPAESERLNLEGVTVDPHQFLGIEKNPRAVPVAELVLWIGHLQWHFRTRGSAPPAEPILRDFRNIEGRDALLDYAHEEPERDGRGVPVTRWGGRRTLHPITSESVPDDTDRTAVMRPIGAKAATWPEADFIVGNPPFVAGKDLRAELGSGAAEALWKAYPKVPPSADLAMHFWWKAAQALRQGKGRLRRFGFITSNSIRQVFCRRVVAEALDAKPPLHLAMAVPDHPWADGAGTAAVRIAFTVVAPGAGDGELLRVAAETVGAEGVPAVVLDSRHGRINADLSLGTDVKVARPLRANDRLCSPGVKLHGSGFLVTPVQAAALGLGKVEGLERHIRPYLNGRDLQQRSRGLKVIDAFGLAEPELRARFPDVWQHLFTKVKPERDVKDGTADARQYARDWWLFGKPRPELRRALDGLRRYIATVETTKHRVFSFVPAEVLPDNMLVAIAADDGFTLGVLQSRVHLVWFMAACGWLGVGNDPRYNKTQVFDPFPFPAATPVQRAEVAALAEELDALRKARLAAHPHLTFTALYNVLAALRAGRALTAAEKDIHDAGHVSILRALHDRLDGAVLAAYGWPADATDAELVARVVALNAERVAEEAAGQVRWLRPALQAPKEAAPRPGQSIMDIAIPDAPGAVTPWPKAEPAQYALLRRALHASPATPRDLARRFKGAPRMPRLAVMLETLAGLGQARQDGIGRYVA